MQPPRVSPPAGELPPIPVEESEPDIALWTWRDTLVGTLATLVPLVLLNLLLSGANGGAATQVQKLTSFQDTIAAIVQFVFTTALEAVFLIAPLIYALRRHGRSGLRRLGFRPTSAWMTLIQVVMAMVVTLVFGYLYTLIAQKLTGVPPTTNLDQLLKEVRLAPRTILASGIVATLFAPIFEEIFFRGFLLQGLRLVLSDFWAVIISAAVFAIVHLSPGSTILLFILGLILGYLRVTTRSLWPGIALHALNNALGLVQIILLIASSH